MLTLPIALSCFLIAADSISPARLYFQIDRPVPVTINSSAEKRELVLLEPSGVELARVDVPPTAPKDDGTRQPTQSIDLASAFPDLWQRRSLFYVQLLADGNAVGPALVCQPMKEQGRPVVRYETRGGQQVPMVESWPVLAPEAQFMTGFRVYPERFVLLQTSLGSVTLGMRPDEAPNTAWNFLELVRGGFYTDIPIHRIVPRDRNGDPFVVQAGDPTGTGEGGPGYSIDLEPTRLPHDLGVISMARAAELDTAGSQFFICLSRRATARLDTQYAAFGQTVSGLDTVERLGNVPVDEQSQRPIQMPYVTSAILIDAAPRVPGVRAEWMGPAPAGPEQREVPAKPVDR